MRLARALLGLFLLCLYPNWGVCQEKGKSNEVSKEDLAKAKALFEEGERYFYSGEIERAAKLYQEAYLLSRAPILLKNIAVCYEKLGKFAEARHEWEAFFRSLSPKDPYYREAKQRMEELSLILESQLLVTKTPDVSPPPLTLPTVTVELKEPPKSPKRWLLYSGAASGAVLGGVALVFLLSRDVPGSSLGAQPLDF